MKTKLLMGLFAIGLLSLNFSFSNKESQEKKLTLQNIALMQANAAEMECAGTNDKVCSIETEAGVGISTGPLVVKN